MSTPEPQSQSPVPNEAERCMAIKGAGVRCMAKAGHVGANGKPTAHEWPYSGESAAPAPAPSPFKPPTPPPIETTATVVPPEPTSQPEIVVTPPVAAVVQPQPTAVVVAPPRRSPVLVGSRGIELRTIDELKRLADFAVEGKLAGTPAEAVIKMQRGMEIGLPPLTALQIVYVINGRSGIPAETKKALVEQSGLCESYEEWFEHNGVRVDAIPPREKCNDDTAAVARTKRVGRETRTMKFSVGDAKQAKLWEKAGSWMTYPQRMLVARNRGYLCGDVYPDVVMGLPSSEELADLEEGEIPMPRRAGQ